MKSFKGRLREECLNATWFLRLEDARVKIEAWRRDPHSITGQETGETSARAAHALGLTTMVGSKIGTSLAMVPSFLVGQLYNAVGLDGRVFLKADRAITVQNAEGFIMCPETLWS